jgi:hypothetical protein
MGHPPICAARTLAGKPFARPLLKGTGISLLPTKRSSMTKIKRVELECVTCKSWIPFSIDLVGSNSADASKEVDRILRCPACSALAPFRHERMRLAGNDGKSAWDGA